MKLRWGTAGAMAAALAGGWALSGSERVLRGSTMGTTYEVRAEGSLPEGLGRRLQARLDRIERAMSTWREDSEVSRFNRWRSGEWFPVSEETALVVEAALGVSRETGGAFDVTVFPLVELWGFGPRGRGRTVPGEAAIEAARARVDYRNLEARARPPALRKLRPDLEIDLSAIAKGYAVDALVEELEAAGARDALVEVGGEVRARGRPRRIALERADGPGGDGILELSDAAVATSGDYRNVYEAGGRRYPHVIDPRTGRPVPHGPASASVLDPRAMIADAWATAILVLGPRDGLAAAEAAGRAARCRDAAGEAWTAAWGRAADSAPRTAAFPRKLSN